MAGETKFDIDQDPHYYDDVIDRYKDDEDIDVQRMAQNIRNTWESRDNEVRQRHGYEPVRYGNDPEKNFYAYTHSLALRRAILDSRKIETDGSVNAVLHVWAKGKTTKNHAKEDIERYVKGIRSEHILKNMN